MYRPMWRGLLFPSPHPSRRMVSCLGQNTYATVYDLGYTAKKNKAQMHKLIQVRGLPSGSSPPRGK